MGQLEPDVREVRSLPGGVLEINRADDTGVRIPCLQVMVSTQGYDTLGQAWIEVGEEKKVPAIAHFVDVAQGGSRRDRRPGKRRREPIDP